MSGFSIQEVRSLLLMPGMGIVNILPFFKLQQLNALQHFFFLPIVTRCQCFNRDGNYSVMLSPTCGINIQLQWQGVLQTLFKRVMKSMSEKQSHFQYALPCRWGNKGNTEACEQKRLENCCLWKTSPGKIAGQPSLLENESSVFLCQTISVFCLCSLPQGQKEMFQ